MREKLFKQHSLASFLVCERSMIQTFPEDFSFDGTKTDIEQMIGNAVPVNLGYFVADAIFRNIQD